MGSQRGTEAAHPVVVCLFLDNRPPTLVHVTPLSRTECKELPQLAGNGRYKFEDGNHSGQDSSSRPHSLLNYTRRVGIVCGCLHNIQP